MGLNSIILLAIQHDPHPPTSTDKIDREERKVPCELRIKLNDRREYNGNSFVYEFYVGRGPAVPTNLPVSASRSGKAVSIRRVWQFRLHGFVDCVSSAVRSAMRCSSPSLACRNALPSSSLDELITARTSTPRLCRSIDTPQ